MSRQNKQHEWYRKDGAAQYHKTVFSDDEFVRHVIASNRALKLQPFINDDDEVLEYGVGICLNLRYLSCRHRAGYDVSTYGREACDEAGVEFHNDIEGLEGRLFSKIICHHVLEHVPDPLTSLKQMNNLLTPGGRLVLCVPYEHGRDYLHYYPDDIHRHLYSWNPRSISNILSEAGFNVNDAYIGPYGYEQRLAPLAKYSFAIYRFGLTLIRVVKPFREVIAIAEKPMEI